MLLKEQVIVVTGGAGLIGRSFVDAILGQGGIAIIADRDEDGGDGVVKTLQSQHPQAAVCFAKTDITSKQSLQELIAAVHQKYGRIDALVNNAYPRNPQYGRKFEDVEFEDFNQNVGMHLGGYFLASQQFAAYFKKQERGSIVNMASIYGVVAPRFEVYGNTPMTMPVEYAAIKSAVVHLTKYLASYLKGSGIRVNSISPGGILDAQPEAFLVRYNSYSLSKGMLEPRDLQGALLFLLSNMSQFVNGQNIIVDDGWSL